MRSMLGLLGEGKTSGCYAAVFASHSCCFPFKSAIAAKAVYALSFARTLLSFVLARTPCASESEQLGQCGGKRGGRKRAERRYMSHENPLELSRSDPHASRPFGGGMAR